MGKKDLRNRTQFTSTLENSLYKQLQEISQSTGMPISKMLDKAVTQYLIVHPVNIQTHPRT